MCRKGRGTLRFLVKSIATDFDSDMTNPHREHHLEMSLSVDCLRTSRSEMDTLDSQKAQSSANSPCRDFITWVDHLSLLKKLTGFGN